MGSDSHVLINVLDLIRAVVQSARARVLSAVAPAVICAQGTGHSQVIAVLLLQNKNVPRSRAGGKERLSKPLPWGQRRLENYTFLTRTAPSQKAHVFGGS